jgi:hypothetical protein
VCLAVGCTADKASSIMVANANQMGANVAKGVDTSNWKLAGLLGVLVVGLSAFPTASAVSCPVVETFNSIEVAPYMGLWCVRKRGRGVEFVVITC